MYMPALFQETDTAVMHALMQAHPLGTLVVHGSAGLAADHVPFLVNATENGSGTLHAHVARANPVWREALAGELDALVIFQGASAYVSPSLYPSKAETHRVVPTYNYMTVHVHGRITVHDDEKWLRGLLARLTGRFEQTRERPWRMGEAPADFIADRLKEIVGIEIAISRLEGKWKMSQNRTDADRQGVVDGLRAEGKVETDAVALEVERRMKGA